MMQIAAFFLLYLQPMMSKADIRSFVRTLPRPSEKEALEVMATIEATEVFRTAAVVLLYWSIANELSTREMLSSWSCGRRIILPRVEGDTLVLAEYAGAESLTEGKFGIMEPAQAAPIVNPDEIELAIIPGMAFDPKGHRLGHGKGYYDRLLAMLHCPVIGIAQQAQIVENVPVEPHDRGVDIVITPLNCYFCKI